MQIEQLGQDIRLTKRNGSNEIEFTLRVLESKAIAEDTARLAFAMKTSISVQFANHLHGMPADAQKTLLNAIVASISEQFCSACKHGSFTPELMPGGKPI